MIRNSRQNGLRPSLSYHYIQTISFVHATYPTLHNRTTTLDTFPDKILLHPLLIRLHLLLRLPRIPTTTTILRLPMRLGLIPAPSAAIQMNPHPPLIRLRLIPQSFLLTQLLYRGLNLLNMSWRMIALPHNHMQHRLLLALHLLDTYFQDIFRFMHELPVQIDLVVFDATGRVIFAENVFARLFVERFHLVVVVCVVGLAGAGPEVVVVSFDAC